MVSIETSTYKGIPAMSSPKVHAFLKEVGRHWTGQGTAMELGCWLGGSALPLLEGLKEARYDRMFWAFDKWQAYPQQMHKAKQHGVKLKNGQDLLPLFMDNVDVTGIHITAIKGVLPHALMEYQGDRIEICMFDAPKAEPVFSGCISALMDLWVPGVTVLGLMDYKFYQRHSGPKREKFMAPVLFMQKHAEHFEIIKQWDDECPVFFRYKGGLKL